MGLSSINNTQIPKKTKVLIAGAGPTGLMMACQLRRMGIDCIIIDIKDGPTIESRALVVHARSLEIYDQMGIADETVKNGEVMGIVRLLSKSIKIAEVRFGEIGMPYMLLQDGACLYDKIKEMKFHLLVLLKKEKPDISTKISLTVEKSKNILNVLEINKEEKNIYDKLGVRQDMLILVRPDYYIAAIASISDIAAIHNYFRFLVSENTQVYHSRTEGK